MSQLESFLYKSRYDGTRLYAKKIARFMQTMSMTKGIVHGLAGDYIVRDCRSGDISFIRADVFEDEFERTRG